MRSGSPVDGTLSIELAPPGSAAPWNDFVGRHPRGTYCHLFEWREVAEASYGRSCNYLVARRAGEVAGVLPLVWMPGRLAGRRLVSMPYLDLGGPLAEDEAVEGALLHAALNLAEGLGARSIELRESANPGDDAQTAGRYRFVLELPSDPKELWKALGPKVRNQVRKAEKSGVETSRVAPERLPEFYSVFSRNMRDLGSPVHSQRFLGEIFDRFAERAHLYLTSDADGHVVAGAIGISFAGGLSVPWASALRSARRLCPNHSLYWTILAAAVRDGVSSFDFGRSSTGSGTYRFKKQWGARPVRLAWRELDRSGSHPEAAGPASSTRRVVAGAWKRLPLGLANRLGPLIRGHLPQ